MIRQVMRQAVRNLRGGSVNLRALNAPGELPFSVFDGSLVFATRFEFDYQGPATQLQVGFGWKPGPADFNNGDNLYGFPQQGFGHTAPISVPDSLTFLPFFSDLIPGDTAAQAAAPQVGPNTRRGGTIDNVTLGQGFQTWIWIYDTATLGFFALGPDTAFLSIITEPAGDVIVAAGPAPPPPPPPPPEPVLQSVSVSPGTFGLDAEQSIQFSATAHYNIGSPVDVTSQASWSGSSALINNGGGSFTARTLSSTTQVSVQASFGGKTGVATGVVQGTGGL